MFFLFVHDVQNNEETKLTFAVLMQLHHIHRVSDIEKYNT